MLTEQHNTNPLSMYDITASCNDLPLDEILIWCRMYCSRWCFQQERGADTGYEHWQIRVSLITKKRLLTMIPWCHSTLSHNAHISPTSKPTFYTGNEFYVMKIDTRIAGPWSNKTDVNSSDFPDHLKNDKMEWWPWQQKVLNISLGSPANNRTINVIIDPDGESGKSTLASWLSVRKLATRIPPMESYKDIMRMIMCEEITKIYFIDLPRAINNKNQASIYSGLEEIKNGFCYDDRNHYRKKYFNPPHVWVFTNSMPETKHLTPSRWTFWTIIDRDLINIPIPKPAPTGANLALLNYYSKPQRVYPQPVQSPNLQLFPIK